MFILTATRCPDNYYFTGYTGNYPDLYTVAIKSTLHVTGIAWMEGNPFIRILDEDEFGRVLFSYSEGYSPFGERIPRYIRLISQKTDSEHVYFYEHINFIFVYFNPVTTDEMYFNLTAIEALKYTNNWGQELSCTSEFIRVPITLIPDRRGPVCSDRLIEAGQSAFPNRFREYSSELPDEIEIGERWINAMRYFRSDPYGRSVYSITVRSDETPLDINTFAAFIFQPDHTIDINTGVIILPNRHDYHTEFRNFLESNGWNTVP